MSIAKIVNGQILHELSLTEFKEGLFKLAGENQNLYSELLWEFEKRALDEVIKATDAKNAGKSREQIIFERMRRREAQRHIRRLKRNMRDAGIKKIQNASAHHLVAWGDERALRAREILRQFGIDVDDSINGVWLPTAIKNTPHKQLPNAYAHSTVHTKLYYANITTLLTGVARLKDATKEDIIETLQEIAQELQQGLFPINSRIDER